jgi:hypothetical protein
VTPASDAIIDRGCQYDLVIGSVFQNESRFLREWIEYHQMIGVQRFFLVNDRSVDDYDSVLRPYCDSGIVQILEFPCPERLVGRSWKQYQCGLISAFCRELRGIARWLALIDADEFIVPTAEPTALDYLRAHEDKGAVYAEWQMFGTSGVSKLAESELLTERMTWRMAAPHRGAQMGKSIVKPHRVQYPNIHRCELQPGFSYPEAQVIKDSAHGVLQLNHYWTRDEDFLVNEKLPRKAATKGWMLSPELLDFHRTAYNDVEDRTISRFVPELKRRMRRHLFWRPGWSWWTATSAWPARGRRLSRYDGIRLAEDSLDTRPARARRPSCGCRKSCHLMRPGAVLEEEQHVQVAQEHGVDWKKPVARIVLAWVSRNARQVCPARRGGVDASVLEDLPDGRRASLCPRPANSPWIRRYPQPGLSGCDRVTGT